MKNAIKILLYVGVCAAILGVLIGISTIAVGDLEQTPNLNSVTGAGNTTTNDIYVDGCYCYSADIGSGGSTCVFSTSGDMNCAGNATAAYFFGDGRYLTNLPTPATATLDAVLAADNETARTAVFTAPASGSIVISSSGLNALSDYALHISLSGATAVGSGLRVDNTGQNIFGIDVLDNATDSIPVYIRQTNASSIQPALEIDTANTGTSQGAIYISNTGTKPSLYSLKTNSAGAGAYFTNQAASGNETGIVSYLYSTNATGGSGYASFVGWTRGTNEVYYGEQDNAGNVYYARKTGTSGDMFNGTITNAAATGRGVNLSIAGTGEAFFSNKTSTGNQAVFQKSGNSVFVVENGGTARSRGNGSNSHPLLPCESYSSAITSASTGSITFATTFNATPTVVVSFSTDTAYITYASTYDITTTGAKWITPNPETGVINMIACEAMY